MASHARYGPSKMELYEACPKYVPGGDEEISDAAEEGHEMHEAFEKQDPDLLGTQEQRDAVTACLLYVQGLVSDNPESWEIHREKQLACDETFGTIDWLAICGTVAHVADAKFGRILVSPANVNLQGQSYARLVWENFPEVDRITVHFLAPRLDDVSTCTYYRDPHNHLIKERMERVIRVAADPDSQPIPSEKACRYCSAKAQCPALGQIGLDIVRRSELSVPSPDFFRPGTLATVADRARAQVLAPILEDWAKQVKKNNAQAVAEEGIDIPGFDLRTRAGTPKIDNAHDLIMHLAEHYSVDPIIFAGAITTTINKLADALLEGPESAAKKKDVVDKITQLAGPLVEETSPIRYLQRSRSRTPEDIWNEVAQ